MQTIQTTIRLDPVLKGNLEKLSELRAMTLNKLVTLALEQFVVNDALALQPQLAHRHHRPVGAEAEEAAHAEDRGRDALAAVQDAIEGGASAKAVFQRESAKKITAVQTQAGSIELFD